VLGSDGKEVTVACDDERRDVQARELGMQVASVTESIMLNLEVGRGCEMSHAAIALGRLPRLDL
jgi:hypothetical protein